MTLSPSESRNVIAVSAERYKLTPLCSHPDCTSGDIEAHHLYRRSQIIGSSWFVSIDGQDPIPHVVGLCNEHHRQVTDNSAWIKNENGAFCWYDEDGKNEDDTKNWRYVGLINPQPAVQFKTMQVVKQKKTKAPQEEKKPRKVKSIRCPNDADENGIELLDALIDRAAELIPHRDADSPDYYVLMDALGWFALHFTDG